LQYAASKFALARVRFGQTLEPGVFVDFLTSLCYDDIVTEDASRSGGSPKANL
jgi:hypothetical protein